jgi:hypothetical protein
MVNPETKLYFEDDKAFTQFEREQVMSQIPEECRKCYAVSGKVTDIAIKVDNREISEDEAKVKAQELGSYVTEHCSYGYTVEDGCGLSVICRMG